MFQMLLTLAIGIVIGWNFHLFYLSLDPSNITSKPITSTSQTPKLTSNLEPNITTPNSTHNIIEEKNQTKNLPFYIILKQNHFSDAMALYLEADEKELQEYQFILKSYLRSQANDNPLKSIEEIIYYLEIEPQAQDMKLYLAQLYTEKEEFEKALDILFELRNLNDETYLKLIKDNLNSTIEAYISKLQERKELPTLIQLLERLIYENLPSEKYTLQLAELYYELDIYHKSQELLQEIVYDETYGAKAQKMLKSITLKSKEKQHYSHILPLKKVGSHYSLELLINNTPLRLLLDTGASYTLVDEDRLASLQVEKEIYLNTAGGEIIAHLAKADSLRIQNLELKEFQLTLAPFKRQYADGLLGMDFFSQFEFKIDQDRHLLYLKKKS